MPLTSSNSLHLFTFHLSHAFALIPACTCRGSISCCPPLAGFSDSLFDLIQHPSTIYFLEPLNLFSPQLYQAAPLSWRSAALFPPPSGCSTTWLLYPLSCLSASPVSPYSSAPRS